MCAIRKPFLFDYIVNIHYPLWPNALRPQENSSALQGRWLEEPEGFPTHVSFRKENKTAIMAAAKQTKGSLRPRKENKNGIMAAARRTEGALRPRGRDTPPPLRGSSPCEPGQFFPAGFDCRHSEVCKSRNSVSLNSSIRFSRWC